MSTLTLSAMLLAAITVAEEPSGRTVVKPTELDPNAVEVPAAELEETGASLAETLGRLPGVQVKRFGGPTAFTTLNIRGGKPEQVRIFLDGIPLERADGGLVDLSTIPLLAADRLRLWKNHAPIGFGGSIGGALLVASQRPTASGVGASLTGGSFGLMDLSIRGALLAEDHPVSAVTAIQTLTSDGDYPWLDDGGTLFDANDDRWRRRQNNGVRRLAAYTGASADVGPCSVTLQSHTLAQDRGVPGPASAPTTEVTHARLAQTGSLGARCARPGGWFVNSALALRWQRDASDDPGGELYSAPSEAEREALAPHARALAGMVIKPGYTAKAFGEITHESFRLTDTLNPDAARRQSRTRGALSLGADAFLRPLRLSLLPGARLDVISSPAGSPTAALTGQITAWWKGLRAQGLSIRTSVGTGFRPPSLYELEGDGLRVLANPDLRPERSLTASVGVRYEAVGLPSGWRLGLELDGFMTSMDDVVVYQRNTLWNARAINGSAARLAGFDGRLVADLFRHLRLLWSHATLHSELIDGEEAYRGNPIPLRPSQEDQVRVTAYTRLGEAGRLEAFSSLARIASHTVDLAGLAVLPSRWLFDLGAEVSWETSGLFGTSGVLRVGLALRDLADSAPVDLLGHPLPGRRWSARVGWQEEIF